MCELSSTQMVQIGDAVVIRSNGVFQWVSLILPRIIDMCKNGKAFRQLLKGLIEIPQELNKLYSDIISRLDEQSRSRKLFQWVCFARRPMTVSEIRCAMNVDAGGPQTYEDCRKLDDFVETDEQMELQLPNLSGGLVEVRAFREFHIIQFVHQSVNDYLLLKGFYRLGLSQEENVSGLAHFQISRSCLRCIIYDEATLLPIKASDGSIDGESWRTIVSQEWPILTYAALHWIWHAQAVETH